AVSSGKVWKAGELKHKRDKYLGLRARLQSNGSQSARQHLRKASGKERRHVTHVNHVVSKSIVEQAAKQKAKVIVLEDLTHIRDRVRAGKRVRSRLHRWSFR
ncbi:IS200/IS605 family accessory protein TnpB-related protein, partial [Parasutterella secunda]